jgi:hypothetical protein
VQCVRLPTQTPSTGAESGDILEILLKNEYGLEVLTEATIKSSVFWDSRPCHPEKCKQLPFSGRRLFLLLTCLDYISAVKTETICTSKTSVDKEV